MAVERPLFTPVRLREGYSQPEVDSVVDQLLEDLARPDPQLTTRWIASQRFTPVRMKEGYDMAGVDRWLSDAAYELERRHAAAPPPEARGSADQHSADQHSAAPDTDEHDTDEHEPVRDEVAPAPQAQSAITEVKDGFPAGVLVVVGIAVVLVVLFLLVG